ncbi:hypothetical protein DFR58_102230 [Anaerobacterium chartisolvens]|uniref:Uncharacterized protein n=1 Tax=Anaerobacterium chartisolvens TaxID=1297424 RepID=A0A369BI88_9FIRM|nr:hypothetical protein [Anaerobacterium chartisolvens]RCX20157.1 hypothetical protein DFR58_102230 [Anaerobacterium chartisolvens]
MNIVDLFSGAGGLTFGFYYFEYVRNKLAIENFLNVINNTQAFVNYIEGEIHFDILDEDDLPDIATSNR